MLCEYMKVAVVNRVNLLNFGSVLQVLALVEAVKKFGYDVDVIWERGSIIANYDFRPKKILSIILKLIMYPKLLKNIIGDIKDVSHQKYSEQTKSAFSLFVEKYCPCKYYTHGDLSKVAKSNVYSFFICGSDQVWCSTTLYPDPLMYLRFVPKHKRVAYAPSLGRNYIPAYNKRILKRYISDITKISTRELDSARLINQLIDREVPVVLDPTLLFDISFWLNFALPIKETNFILCYFLDIPSNEVIKQISLYAKGKTVIGLRSRLEALENMGIEVNYPECGPGEFLSYIAHADFVFTDSYHGMLFSINFQKEFCSIARNYSVYDQSSRQKSILEQLEIKDRYHKNAYISREKIDYRVVNCKLIELRRKSFDFLERCLK